MKRAFFTKREASILRSLNILPILGYIDVKPEKKNFTYRLENSLYLHEVLLVLVGRRTNQFSVFKAWKAVLEFYVFSNNLYSAPG